MYTIITRDNCEWCVKAKDLLKENHILFDEISIPRHAPRHGESPKQNLLSKEEFYDLVEKYNTTKTVPKIFNGKILIGGYEELEDLILQQQREKANHGDGGL